MNRGSVNNKSIIINGMQTQITGKTQAHTNDSILKHSVCSSESKI